MSETAILTQPGARLTPAAPRRPELLAPAGDWDCVRAAVENGADAIYFGLDRFNARMRARNFTESDLPKLMEFLHRRGVRGYVTFNTLVFADELAAAEQHLRSIIAAGVDAAIVQDVGICRLIRELSPDFPIHASTQMTVTSAAGVEFVRDLGCSLVVLARECSIAEIGKIQAATAGVALPLEVFVHGALCVAYSGQCLTSEALGGRSANRGECAQACRMPYELISDGQTVPLGDRRYLLSPQDLSGLEVLPDLVRSGVASLKIEGRLKSPEYVANITRVYRQALDRVTVPGAADFKISPAEKYDLEMGFSRGLYTGWFRGINNQELAHARFGKKRGVLLGEVLRIDRGRANVFLRLVGPVKRGDGVVFDAGRPDQEEEGGRIYDVRPGPDGETVLAFGDGDVDFTRVQAGNKLWKTNDPELDRRLRQSFAGDQPHFARPIHLEVHGAEGTLLTVIARDEIGHVARVESSAALVRAEKQPLTKEKLAEQLGRLGGTPFRLGSLENRVEGRVMAPVSELNRVRRTIVADLDAQRAKALRWQMNERGPRHSVITTAEATPRDTEPELIVLVRSLDQLEAALGCGVATIYCEFEDPKKYRTAVMRFHEAEASAACKNPRSEGDLRPSPSIWVAPPRITKPGEEWILELVRSSSATGFLLRNYDHLNGFKDVRRIGDFSFNVANPLAADHFMTRHGLERVTASYDLNIGQLEALARATPPNWLEVTIHQHMPMFHMEHCVFCAFLSKGTDFRNCGRPCDRHEVKLRDRVGMEHPLKADAGCRNTVFNARAQTGAESVSRLIELGLRHFRIEFVGETAAEAERTIGQYRRLLRGEISGTALWRELKLINQLGVTRGQMEKTGG